MNCPNCGHPETAQVKVCSNCGEAYASQDLLELRQLEYLTQEATALGIPEAKLAPYAEKLGALRARLVRPLPAREAAVAAPTPLPVVEEAPIPAPPAPAAKPTVPPAPLVTRPVASQAPPPAPAPAVEVPAAPPPPPAMEEMPKTGSVYPRIAAAGLALALIGLSLGRKAR